MGDPSDLAARLRSIAEWVQADARMDRDADDLRAAADAVERLDRLRAGLADAEPPLTAKRLSDLATAVADLPDMATPGQERTVGDAADALDTCARLVAAAILAAVADGLEDNRG